MLLVTSAMYKVLVAFGLWLTKDSTQKDMSLRAQRAENAPYMSSFNASTIDKSC